MQTTIPRPERASSRRCLTTRTAACLSALIMMCHPCFSETLVLSLDDCITVALERNHASPASDHAVAAAEAQHRQAQSGYWPQLSLDAGYLHLNESPNFIFPAGTMAIPPQSMSVPGGDAVVTVPAGSLGPGFPPADMELPISYPDQTINVPGQQFPIPEQDIKLMDNDSILASVKARWLVLDGGMRRGIKDQAAAGVDAANQARRRTALEITDSVTRLYYGAVMARQVLQIGQDTLARMEATLELTKSMYTDSVGRVKKTDYLNNKVMVSTIRAAVVDLERQKTLAEAALAYTVGMSYADSIVPIDEEIPFQPVNADLEMLVSDAFSFSPDWKELEAGIRAAEGALKEAKSAYYPKVAVTGELHSWWNSLDAGLATDVNKQGWSAGVGLELPLFNGFLTQNRVREARARLAEIRENRVLLREGLGLQIRQILLGINAAEGRHTATLDAKTAAAENRDLNIRAYQSDLVDTEEVIRAQLTEAIMAAQYYKTRFDHAELLSRLNLIVGAELNHLVAGPQ